MNNRGQSILEVILAMAIFALIGSAIATMAVGGFAAMTKGGQQTEAEALAQEGVEAVVSIRNGAWNEIIYDQSGVEVSSNEWVFSGEGTTEIIGDYTRTIDFEAVCRDANDEITACPGDYIDLHSQKVTVTVEWETVMGLTNSVQNITYLTNWDSQEWTQTDWVGGDGQAIWSDSTKYDSDGSGYIDYGDAGEAKLVSGDTQDDGFDFATSGGYSWPFITDSNYTYDDSKIEVDNGYAQLISSGGASSSGETSNEGFDSDNSGWSFYTWGVDGGEVTPTGSWQSSSGNPGGYVNINIPYNAKNDEVGGYWEQSISITEDGSDVTCYFDWRITQWVASGGVDDYQFYVFLDSSSGAPIIGNEIWSSGTQSSATSWSGQQNIDCSSVATTAGTYYYKLAVWLDTAGSANTGPITAGYDNAKVYWEGVGSSYSTDVPDIYPVSSFSLLEIENWDSFTETASKDGGEIYYQLSDNNGSTWQYWNGLAWVTAGASNYNTASVVNTNIGSFDTTSNQIKFKAFLESDGTQFVQLDNINISYSATDAVWTFYSWDLDGGEPIPTGNQYSTGGNPGGYVDIAVPAGSDYEVGGYWEQPFTTYNDNPTDMSLDFDYQVIDYNGSPNLAHIRVYIDTASGEPVTQVGSTINVTGEGSWTSATTMDPSSAVTTAGTYYLKVAFWAKVQTSGPPETPPTIAGPFNIGYDNVNIDLGTGEYPVSEYLISSAYDMLDTSPVQIVFWDETIPSGTDLEFQVRTAPDSSGSPGTWTDWYGDSGSGDYYTVASGTLISTDLNGNQWVQYRAELTSDGNETPVLEEISINYK